MRFLFLFCCSQGKIENVLISWDNYFHVCAEKNKINHTSLICRDVTNSHVSMSLSLGVSASGSQMLFLFMSG